MKKYHWMIPIICAGMLMPAIARAQAPAADSCVVSGYVYMNNLRPAANKTLTVKKVVKSGQVIATGDTTYKADGAGFIRMRLWRNSTTYIYSPDIAAFSASPMTGTAITIPDAATAAIETIQPAVSVPSQYVIAIPRVYGWQGAGDSIPSWTIRTTGGILVSRDAQGRIRLQLNPDSIAGGTGVSLSVMVDSLAWNRIVFGDSLAARALALGDTAAALRLLIGSGGGGGITLSQLADSLAARWLRLSDSLDADPRTRIDITARNIAAGKAGADSVATQILLVKNLIAGKASADSIHSQLVVLYNIAGGLADADSVHTVLNTIYNVLAGHADADSLSLQIALVKNILGGKGDSDSLSAVSDTAKTANLAANTARAVADAHIALTSNPHSVTAAQIGATTIAVVSDSLAARALAIGDSLLAMRGFVRLTIPGFIADSLAKYPYLWLMADTTKIASILDILYARYGGNAVDSLRLLPKYGNTKTVLGNLGFGDKPTVNWSFIGNSSGAKIQMWDFNTQLLGLYGCSDMAVRYCGYEVFQIFGESFTRTFGSGGKDSTKRAHHQVIRANNPSSYVTSFEYSQQSFLHLIPVGVNVWQPKSNFHVQGGVRSDSVITPIIVKDDGSPVHIPSVKSDSTVYRYMHKDSLGWRLIDTGYVRETGRTDPSGHYNRFYDGGGYKHGSKTFEMRICDVYNRLMFWSIRSDSANGVRILGAHIKWYGTYFQNESDRRGWGYYHQYAYTNWSGGLYTVNVSNVTGTGWTGDATGSSSYMPLKMQTGNVSTIRMELEVLYELPKGNNSINPITIHDW